MVVGSLATWEQRLLLAAAVTHNTAGEDIRNLSGSQGADRLRQPKGRPPASRPSWGWGPVHVMPRCTTPWPRSDHHPEGGPRNLGL